MARWGFTNAGADVAADARLAFSDSVLPPDLAKVDHGRFFFHLDGSGMGTHLFHPTHCQGGGQKSR